MAKKKVPLAVSEYFRNLGKKHGSAGGKIGGKRSLEIMTPAKRTARAEKAVAASAKLRRSRSPPPRGVTIHGLDTRFHRGRRCASGNRGPLGSRREGENLARKEDLDCILAEVKGITRGTEAIKAEIQSAISDRERQMRWRIDVYMEAIAAIAQMSSALGRLGNMDIVAVMCWTL